MYEINKCIFRLNLSSFFESDNYKTRIDIHYRKLSTAFLSYDQGVDSILDKRLGNFYIS